MAGFIAPESGEHPRLFFRKADIENRTGNPIEVQALYPRFGRRAITDRLARLAIAVSDSTVGRIAR